jgi:hypothetical protein
MEFYLRAEQIYNCDIFHYFVPQNCIRQAKDTNINNDNICKIEYTVSGWHLHASSIRMAVQVMLPGDRRQHPATPVQNATNTEKNATMKSAIIDRPISAK